MWNSCQIEQILMRWPGVGPEKCKAKQSCVSMETALWPIAHKCIGKSGNIWPWRVRCQWLCCAWRILQIYEMSVYLFKCLSLFVSVLQWIKDALIENHLFMISGTSCYWTAHGALDCGIAMAGLALREPSFNPDGRGLWMHFAYTAHIFFTLCWLTYTHISLILHMSTEMLWNPTWECQTEVAWDISRVGTAAGSAKTVNSVIFAKKQRGVFFLFPPLLV